MLTDVDKPLDKLDDLRPEEMCVYSLLLLVVSPFLTYASHYSENMRGWFPSTVCNLPPLTLFRRLERALYKQVHCMRKVGRERRYLEGYALVVYATLKCTEIVLLGWALVGSDYVKCKSESISEGLHQISTTLAFSFAPSVFLCRCALQST